jgi:large subunit ribosomal protein L17
MRHQKRIAKLGRPADQRKALLQSLARAMLINGKIKTTDAKAKELRRVVERLITFGKKGTVHTRRQAYRLLQDRDLIKKLFEHIAPQYANRNGGYTRIVKLGFRDNDNAAVSLIEFVDYKQSEEEKKTAADRAAKKAQAKAKKEKEAAAAKEIPEAEVAEEEPVEEKPAKKTKTKTKSAEGTEEA